MLRSARVRLLVPPSSGPLLEAQATSLQLPVLHDTVESLQLRCGSVLLEEPRWRCDDAQLQVGRSPLGAVRASLAVELDSSRGHTELSLSGMPLAGGQLRVHASGDNLRWRVDEATLDTALPSLSQWLQRWWQPPAEWQFDGRLSLRAEAAGHGTMLEGIRLQARLGDLDLQNAAGTLVGEKLAAEADLRLQGSLQQASGSLQLTSAAGQLLAGPVLLDFSAHPTQVTSGIGYSAGALKLHSVHVTSSGLIEAEGEAQLALAAVPSLRSLRADVTQLEFPAAYASFLQLPLAATEFGNLDARGRLRGQLQVSEGRLASLDLGTGTDSLDFTDSSKGLALQGIRGEFHWLPAEAMEPTPSSLQWQALRAFGLRGGSTTLQVRAQGDTLQLLEPVRVPLFDGALTVQRFDARRLGSPDVVLAFDGQVSDVGMPELSRAFGWPEMAGTLSGRLPGLEYRGGTLSVAGDITAEVFDGTVVASGLQLRNPFSRFPRFSGNFTARRLDLGLVTRTFPIGSITGRLDADVRGLEMFGWQAVAFDAQLFTTPGDRTRHRISQRAVGNLANLGGGGGGVMAALQSGFLRFFDDFGYERIGLRCQLRNDVCLMSGIPRPDGSFYIVKGGGLPRLDVIGTSGRIAWSQLVSQIGAALTTGAVEVR